VMCFKRKSPAFPAANHIFAGLSMWRRVGHATCCRIGRFCCMLRNGGILPGQIAFDMPMDND
jgi:hypothetical protein